MASRLWLEKPFVTLSLLAVLESKFDSLGFRHSLRAARASAQQQCHPFIIMKWIPAIVKVFTAILQLVFLTVFPSSPLS